MKSLMKHRRNRAVALLELCIVTIPLLLVALLCFDYANATLARSRAADIAQQTASAAAIAGGTDARCAGEICWQSGSEKLISASRLDVDAVSVSGSPDCRRDQTPIAATVSYNTVFFSVSLLAANSFGAVDAGSSIRSGSVTAMASCEVRG